MTGQNYDNFIGGDWVPSDTYVPNQNPSDIDDVIGHYAQATSDHVARAIRAANTASTQWASSTIQQRFDALDFIGSEILDRKAALGDLLAREEGKTLAEAVGEVARAGHIFKFFAGEALRIEGHAAASVRAGVSVEVTREAVGTVGLITPWNFPIAIPAWKIAPALAYGNTVVFKPSGLVPGSAWALSEIISRAGLPAGTFNLVIGSGSVVGNAIVETDGIDAISFTGSVTTGKKIRERAVARGAKVQMEMGGKNPLVILDDASLKIAVDCALQGAFYSTGQRCTASSRIIVTERIHDKFVKKLKKAMKALVVGDARDERSQIGPVVDQSQFDSNERYIDIARKEGGEVFEPSGTFKGSSDGYFMRPVLVTGTTPDMTINREEVFGPIASVIKVKDYEEALEVANDCEFGLSSGICTKSLEYANDFKRRSDAGMVMVNLPTAGVDYHVPFGGRKGSSYGPREQGRFAAEFYTTVKTAYTRAP